MTSYLQPPAPGVEESQPASSSSSATESNGSWANTTDSLGCWTGWSVRLLGSHKEWMTMDTTETNKSFFWRHKLSWLPCALHYMWDYVHTIVAKFNICFYIKKCAIFLQGHNTLTGGQIPHPAYQPNTDKTCGTKKQIHHNTVGKSPANQLGCMKPCTIMG